MEEDAEEAKVEAEGGEQEAMMRPLNLINAHYFCLPSQGNVYTMTPLTDTRGVSKVLVASLHRKVYCLEYSNCRPYMREVPLRPTYMPGGAEIVSIDAFNRSTTEEDFVIGITIIKKDESGKQSQFLNVYPDWDLSEGVSQSGFALELDYIPYHLYHTKAPAEAGWQTVWLLSGSDASIHVYQSAEDGVSCGEVATDDVFPEFAGVDGITLWMDVAYSHQYTRRVTVTGGESGNVHMFSVAVADPPVVRESRCITWDYPVAAARIFTRRNYLPVPDSLKDVYKYNEEDAASNQDALPTIVVGTTLESCFIYSNFPEADNGVVLGESAGHDAVTCCLVCDIDMDGANEVLIGTYGQSVLVYKESGGWWRLGHTQPLPSPVLSLAHCDLVGDGTRQLVVLTTTGVHVFQHDPWDTADLILGRLEQLVASRLGVAPPRKVKSEDAKERELKNGDVVS